MSVVIQSAITAFHHAVAKPAAQPSLAALRRCQQVLYADLVATLCELPSAPDLLVRGDAIGQTYLFTNGMLQRWTRRWPEGVIWPITVATSVGEGGIAAPLRLLLMVPMGTPTVGLDVARSLARKVSDAAWPGRHEEALGKGAAVFLGMYANDQGHWEFGPAALWTLPGDNDLAVSKGLPLVNEFVRVLTQENFEPDAVTKLASDYVADEIGIVIHSDG